MIARNLYRDARRAPAPVALSDAVDVSDWGSGPEASTGARHELKVVMHALQATPELDRAALLMATMEGLSHETSAWRSGFPRPPSRCASTGRA